MRGFRIHLIRSDATPRAMRVVDGQLRARVGYSTMIDPRLETVRLDQVALVEVLAPYAPPTRRIATLWTGATFGALAGAVVSDQAAMVMAVVFATFAAVAAIAGGMGSTAYKLARLDMRDGGSRIITYSVEDEDEFRKLFPEGTWRDDNVAAPDVALLPDEADHADALRIGLVLGAAGLAMGVLVLTFRLPSAPSTAPSEILIPGDVLQYASFSIVLFVAVKAWFMMIQNHRRRRRK